MKKTVFSLPAVALLVWAILLGALPSSAGNQSQPAGIYSSLDEIPGYREHPLVLVFISLTCHVCWEELFELKDFVETMNLPVILVGVSTENREQLVAFVRRYSFRYPLVEDRDKTLFRRFRVRLEPFVVVLDPAGKVFHQDDPILDFQARRDLNKKKILELLEGKSPG